ncbi:MAG: SRPBCC domain-containing protein [Spirochaetia bacterium]|nr:SRPBCC domain-containing protein [Spirochaetia bacterium]
MNKSVVREVVIHASPARIWKAITDKNEMKQWYFDLAEFEPRMGFEFRFDVCHKDKEYIHLCKVTEVIAEKRITYSWRYDGYAGNSFVTFELLPEGTSTRVRLTHSGLETFPENNPDLARGNFEQGWTSLIDDLLKKYVEKVERIES